MLSEDQFDGAAWRTSFYGTDGHGNVRYLTDLSGHVTDSFDYDAILGGLASTIPPDPAAGANFYRSDGTTHFWNVRQPRPATREEARLDSLFDVISAAPDVDVRRRISASMEQVIGDACWVIWLPVNTIKLPVRNRFVNVHPSSLRPRVLWNIETVFVRPGKH